MKPPFGGDLFTNISFDEREHNITMMYIDALLAVIGGITSIFGLYVDGFTPLLSFLLIISIMMASISIIRYTREREMKRDSLGAHNGEPPDTH